MWTYIVRRLLLMLVTLFGITLVTYAIMTLTPGDPAQMAIQAEQMAGGDKGNLSKEDIERIRAQFGLDKPAFFNTSPTDREAYLRRRLEDYDESDADILKKLPERLRELGAAGLAPAFRILEAPGTAENADKLPAHVIAALPELADGLRVAPPKAPALDAAAWQSWWVANQGSLDGAAEAVAKAAKSKDGAQIPELRASHGTLCVRPLMAVLDDDDIERRRWAVDALCRIAGKPSWTIESDASLDDAAVTEDLGRWVHRWKNWWRQNHNRYSDITGPTRAWRMLAETQYGTWIGNLVDGELGESTYYRKPVMEILPDRIEVTLMLSVASIILAYLIAIPLGIFSASNPYTITDKLLTTVLFILYSLPTFWVGNLLILFFTGGDTFPFDFPYASNKIALSTIEATGAEKWKTWIYHLALPLFCFTYTSFAYLSRQMRASMMEVIRADFIRTARAKGLSERVVVFKHALRNSLIPILTIMANILPRLIGGSVIIETIFTVDGMGELVFTAVFNRDYPIVMAVGFFSAVLTLIGILLSDLSYALVDPRITYD